MVSGISTAWTVPRSPLCRLDASTQLLQDNRDANQRATDVIEQRHRIDQHDACDDQQAPLENGGLVEEPALQAASQRYDAERCGDRDERNGSPVGLAERLE